MRADDMTLYLGNDPYHTGFNGEMKGWNISIGSGSFREKDFEDLL